MNATKNDTQEITTQERGMVEEFQCSGCVAGMDVRCGKFKLWRLDKQFACQNQCAGTRHLGIANGLMALGLPKGFDRVGQAEGRQQDIYVRLSADKDLGLWDKLNVAVWALEQDGYLFVRTFSPRINKSYVDVIKGGKLSLVPGAVNVGEFKDDID